jgi:poly-beta-1,6-N-acetyl-D-glucosamine synthase
MNPEFAFCLAIVILIYTYVGYPLLVWVFGRWYRPLEFSKDCLPTISIVIVACDEEKSIRRKIRELVAADYPSGRFEIVIASDGSKDLTAKLSRDESENDQEPKIEVIEFDDRRGKSAVLNDVIPGCRGEIIILSDVRQRFNAGALRALVAPFSSPEIGAVGGELVFVEIDEDGSEIRRGMTAYWRYEKFIRASESRLYSTVGVSGAIYAIRRALYEPIPDEMILDDVLIPMRIVRKGFRVILVSDAQAYDRVSLTAKTEFERKVRTIAGNFQLFSNEPWLLLPWANPIWWQTVSHKLCRLLSPAFLLIAIASSAFLINDTLFAGAFAIQLVFYGAALIGYGVKRRDYDLKWLNIPYTFCLLNWATVIAFWRFIRGQQRVTWNITHVR